jgi:Arm DNA-binding domain
VAKLEKVSDRGVKHEGPGVHALGHGLYLDVKATGGRSWVYRYMLNGKSHWMGLGAYPEIGLADAREAALEARRLHKRGVDPLAEKRKEKAVIPTFGAFAETVIASQSEGFRNEKHAAQVAMTLREYAKPLRDLPVDQIETADILATLKPHWEERRATAERLRGRLEKVLDAARAKGYIADDRPNPARWKGHSYRSVRRSSARIMPPWPIRTFAPSSPSCASAPASPPWRWSS